MKKNELMKTLPLRICSNEEMRKIDKEAETEFLISTATLMENAGRAATDVLLERYPDAGTATEIIVFAGKGNNAGDGFVLARRLMCLEKRVRVFHLQAASQYTGIVKQNLEILMRMKAKLVPLDQIQDLESFFKSSVGPFTAVDALVGTGLRGSLSGLYYEVVQLMNQTSREVISLDIPSGVNGDSGSIQGTSALADLTVSFGFPKLGHFLPPGATRRGTLVNVDISLPPKFRKDGKKFLLTPEPLSKLIKDRDRYGHKNSFGHSLLIGGSPGRLGAISMSARACHKMGTGLVTVGTWNDSMQPLLAKIPDETMAVSIEFEGEAREEVRRTLSQYSSIVVGPGLGLRPDGKKLLEDLLHSYNGPLVIDADALNLVSEHGMHSIIAGRRAPTVLTPHPGEMARLLGAKKEDVTAEPVDSIMRCVDRTGAIVLLKGAATLIAAPDYPLYMNHYPNDGMATAGSGDVLAGMIGGLVGQRMPGFEATLLGIYLHSLAGDFAAREQGHRSMTATDIINNIGHAFTSIKSIEGTKGNRSVSGAQVLN